MARNTARIAAAVAPRTAAAATARKAPARDTAARAPRTASSIVAMIGDVAEPIGSHVIAGKASSLALADTVVASLLSLAYDGAPVELVNVAEAAPGLYAAFYIVGRGELARPLDHVVFFGTPDVAPVSAEPAPAKPARAKATPQVAPLAGMTPLGLKPDAAPARAPKRLPAPAVAAEMKSTAAAAREARTFVMVRVTLEGHGSFDVHCNRADMAEPAGFVRLHVAPRVAAFYEWARVAVDYASKAGASAYAGAVSHAGKRQNVTWCECPVTASAPALPLPLRAGMGNAPRPVARGADALAARMGISPAGAAVAAAEARAKAAGIRLSRADRAMAEATDAATARRAAGKVQVEAAPRMSAANRAVFEAAARGVLPTAPDFSAETHTRYRPKLAELVALVKKGDVAALRAYHINPISTSPKALAKYRDAAVVALTAKAEKKLARAA